VVGTEVPAPGGESAARQAPAPTSPGDAQAPLEAHRAAFSALGLQAAWERVIGLVVQPGVEFGEDAVFDYDRRKARLLSQALPPKPIVYEAHSTDYQLDRALREMVEDHFAILKVGPWLTYAFREAVFTLTAIESEWIGPRSRVRLSRVRETLEAAMLVDRRHWCPYHSGDEEALRIARVCSLSDRCRYYWHQPSVQNEIALLLSNLTEHPAPLTLVSQHLPAQHAALRAGRLAYQPDLLIDDHIRCVLR
jgi:D-tagatose-1,6-bisphosphate aldolase subunit GatZ/KbaZ